MSFFSFATKAVIWLVAAYGVGQFVAVLPFGFVVISVFLFAVPIAMYGAYNSAVNQTRWMACFKTSGWLYRLFAGRFLCSAYWALWALVSSFVMLLQFSSYSWLEWLMLGLAIPIFWWLHRLSTKILSKELKKAYVISSFAIKWTQWLAPTLLVLIYAVLVSWFAENRNFASLAEAVAAGRAGMPVTSGSEVVRIGWMVVSFMDGSMAYLGSTAERSGTGVHLLFILLASYMVFFNTTLSFASFVISPAERRRIFGPLADEETPPVLSRARTAIAAAGLTVATVFIYVPLFAALENTARESPEVATSIRVAEQQAEKIDNEYYRPGTVAAIQLAKRTALEKMGDPRPELLGKIDQAFQLMEGNVDNYLDWYYSLSGEYTRLAALMAGDIETYLQEKLLESLEQDEAFKPAVSAFELALANQQVVADQYQLDLAKLLADNRLPLPQSVAGNPAGIKGEQILLLPAPHDLVSMKSRVVGGGTSAVVGAAVVAKLMSKGVLKTAGTALSKAAVSKSVGSAGGAVLGGLVGSVVPGIGTVAGGVVGGTLAGVVIDAVLLNLEELISREDFRSEIVASIRESRAELKSDLLAAR